MSILGTLTLDISAPTAQLSRDLERAAQMAKEASSRIGTIKPTSNFSGALQGDLRASREILNNSMRGMESDLKRYKLDNYSQQAGRLNATKIIPQVDHTQLTELNKHLTLKEEHLDRVVRKFRDTEIKPRFSQGDEGGDLASSASKSVSSIADAGGSAIGLLASPLSSVIRGSLEGIGKTFTTPFVEGIQAGLMASVSNTVGSQALVGEKIGEAISVRLKSKIGKALSQEITSLADDFLGRENIDRESGSAKSDKANSDKAKTSRSANQFNLDRQELVREQLSSQSELDGAKEFRSRITAASSEARRQVEIRETGLFDAKATRGDNTKLINRLQKGVDDSKVALANIDLLGSEVDASIPEIEARIAQIVKKKKELLKKVDILSPEQPLAYQKIAESAAGRTLKSSEMPKILVDDAFLKREGANAIYSEAGNAMYVTSQIDRQAREGNLTGKNQSTLYHESIHAADFGYGSIDGYRAGKRNQPLVDRNLTAEEVSFASPIVQKYAPEVRQAELNAYGMEYRYKSTADAQDRKNALSDFQQPSNYGFAGERFKRFSAQSEDAQKSDLLGLMKAVPQSEIKDLIEIRRRIKAETSRLIDEIDRSVGKGELSSGLEDSIAANIQDIQSYEQLIRKTKAKQAQGQVKANSETPSDPWQSAIQNASNIASSIGSEIQLSKIAFDATIKGTRQGISSVQQFGKQFGAIAGNVKNALAPVSSVINAGYQIAQGVENSVLPMIPFGNQIKSVGKNIALPAAAYAGIGMLPGGAAIQGALGGGIGDLLSLPAAGMTEAVGGAVGGTLGGVPMIGGALTSASTALASSAMEGAIALISPILAGKAAMSAAALGSKLLLPAQEKPDYDYVKLGQSSSQKAIGAAKSLVQTEYVQLPPPPPPRPALAAKPLARISPASQDSDESIDISPTDFRPLARARIISLRQKMDEAIRSGRKAVSERLYQQFAAEIDQFEAFNKGADAPTSTKVVNQGAIGKWRSVAANRAKKIELIPDDEENLRRQLSDKSPVPAPLGKAIGGFRVNTTGNNVDFRRQLSDDENKEVYKTSPATRRFDKAYSRANRSLDADLLRTEKKIREELSRVDRGEGKLSPVEKGLSGLAKVGVGVLGVFAGFTALSLGAPAVASLGKSALETAANFEKLQIKIAGASDSAQSGRNLFKTLSSQADTLGVSRSSILEIGATVSGTTFGTDLEGAPSESITNQIASLAKARGLDKNESKGMVRALTQMLSKPRISAEEINQLTESGGIADARSIAARSMGLTAQQFTAQQEGGGGIDPQKFLPRFLAQANQDARTGADAAQNSIGFKQTKVDAGQERLLANTGSIVAPVFKAGLDLAIAALSLLNTAIEKGSTALLAFAIGGVVKASAALLPLILNSRFAAVAVNLLVSGLSNIVPAAISMARSLIAPVAQMAAFYLMAESVKQIGKTWSNTSQDIEDAANRIGASLDKANKTPSIDMPKTVDDVQGEGWYESSILFAQRGIKKLNPLKQAMDNFFATPARMLGLDVPKPEPLIDLKDKEDQDRRMSYGKLVERSSKATQETLEAAKKGNQLTAIDVELANLDTQMSGLYSSGSPDAVKLADINERKKAKTAERSRVTEELAPLQSKAQDNVNETKNAVKTLEDQFAKGQIPSDTYNELMPAAKSAAKDAEAAQRKYNESIKSGLDNLTPWLKTLDKIVARFEDIGIASGIAKDRLAIARNDREIGGKITRGGSERQAVRDNEAVITREIEQRRRAVSELTDSLNANNPNNVKAVQAAYSLDDNSTSGQIKLAASGTTNLSDKTTLEKLAVRKDEQNKIESLDAGVSNSHAETYRRIRAENREAALYYTSLAQQIDPTGNAFARVISGMSREKNKFLSKLNNYGTGGFDAYTDAVIELMDITRERMAAQAKAAKDKKDAFDAATNRRNEDAGKRDSDFDTSEKGGKPGKPPAPRNVSQPAAIQGTIQSSQPAKANTPRPNAGASPVANVGSIPKKIKVIKYEKITDSSGYLNSNKSLAPSLGGAFKRLSPVEKKRFLTTSMSANGETDLGFDMRDPSEAALANKLKAKKKNKPVVYSIPYEVEIDNPAYIAAQKRATASKKVGKSIVTTKKSVPKGITAAPRYNDGGRETTTDWRNKSAVLSNRIASDAAAKADRELTDSFDAANLREKKTSRDLERKARLAAQAARKQVRDQNMAQLDSIPVTSVQESQERERMKQQNSFIENREGLTDQITNMVGQIQGFKESINYLGGKKNRTPTESAALSKMLKDLPTTEKILQSLQDQASNLPRTEELAMAKLAENQKYQVEKLKESEELDRKSAERTAIGNDLTNVDQQLTNSPYSEGLRLSKRNLEEKGGNLDAEMARTRAMRAIEDRKREDSSYLPERQKADKRRAEQNYRGAIKNTGQKRSQDSVRTQNELDSEIEKNRIAEQRITDADTGLDIRSREAADKTDAPFANTKAIELKSAQNLAAIDLMLSEKTEQYKELKIKYAGNAQLLASIARQQAESERQIDTEKKILSAETEVSATEVQKQRKAFLYGQQQATAGLEASSRKSTSTELKQRGQDTREFDYRSDVFNRQVETSKTVFDLEQQKASITGITPEAKQAREEIDKLIKGFYDLEASDLSNMAAQFDRLNEVIGETQKATTGVLTEFVKTGKFDWKKILTTGLDKGIEQIMGQVVPNLFGGLYRKPAAVNNATSPNLSKLPPVLDLLPSGPSKQGRWSNITLDTQPMSSPLQPKLDTQPMRSPLQPKIDTPSTPVSVVLAGKEGIAPIPVTIEGGIPPAPTSQYEGMLAGDESLNKYGSAEYIQGAAIAPQITIAPQILGAVGGLLSGGGKGGRGLGLSNILGGLIGGGTGSMLGSIGGLFGFADGGIVPKDSRFNGMRSGNDPIAKALRKEGNNSVIAALTPGERVLTLSESRYYQAMFPRGIEGYKDGGVVGNVRPIPLSLDRGKIDNRGDNNEFNFNIGGDSGDKRGQMDKGQIKDFENAVTAVLLKHKRAKTGLS